MGISEPSGWEFISPEQQKNKSCSTCSWNDESSICC